jgi:hypothetical protein
MTILSLRIQILYCCVFSPVLLHWPELLCNIKPYNSKNSYIVHKLKANDTQVYSYHVLKVPIWSQQSICLA